MDVRGYLRLAMVVLGATVGLLIYAQWRPETAPGGPADHRPRPQMPEGERDVEAVASTLRWSFSDGQREYWTIRAERQIDYADGWNIWEGPEVLIPGMHADRDDDDVRVVGDTMRTTGGDTGHFTEVRLIGNVVAQLPGGGVFETRRIDYDAVTGVASNCNPNELEYAGLLVNSDCLHFQTAGDTREGDLQAEELRMWGDLTIAAAPEAGDGLPGDLEGGAEEMRFRPGGNVVTLEGSPQLAFAGASIQGTVLTLDVGPEARELRQVRAEGGARVRLGDAGGGRRSGERVLTGAGIVIDLADGSALDRLLATAGEAGDARLRLPGQGALSARRIELLPGEGEQEVVAAGNVEWTGDTGGLRRLRTAALHLRVSERGIEEIEADGDVTAALDAEAGESRGFSGPRLTMVWDGGETPAQAEWPEGVEVTLGERVVRAGTASLKEGTWVLAGEPRPRVEDGETDLAADQVRVAADGGMAASGNVEGRLGGSRLAAGGALFGEVASVQFESMTATITSGGQTLLQGSVEVVWESQSLLAGALMLDAAAGQLRASGGADLSAVSDPAAESPRFVTVTARDLLVEEDAAEIHVAGSARMRLGDRQISADRMEVSVGEGGTWDRVVADGEVVLTQPDAEAEGERLEYDVGTGDMLLLGSEERPATFVYDELEYRSPEALRVRWEGEDVIIESTQAGRTTTRVVKREGGEEGG